MGRYTQAVLGQLDRIFHGGTVAGLAEGTLLERFVADGDEAAFAGIVARHGPMVLGVCRRLLREEHDVEDAFQATFLVLVRRAAALRDGDLVGPWLHGVAHRVAVRSRANAARRHAREPAADEAIRAVAAPPSADAARRELRAVLDDELARLPDALRGPLVLCYLEGLTHDEAAQRLGCPVGTVRSRMARARDRLRRQLARRGFEADEAALTTVLAAQPVSPLLIDMTVKASLSFLSGKTAATATSAAAVALAKGVLNAMILAKLKILGASALVCVVALGGVQTFALPFGGPGAAQTTDEGAAKARDRQAEMLRKFDEFQTALSDSTRRNAALKKQVDDLRSELEALRPARPSAASKKGRRGSDVAAKEAKEAGESNENADLTINSPFIRIGENLLLLVSPKGDRVVAYYPKTKFARAFHLTEDKTSSRHIIPIVGPELLTLQVKGSKISRVGALDVGSGTWYTFDLPEPVEETSGISGPRANFGEGLLALGLKGPKISRIAVLNLQDKTWYPFDLREPVENATPRVGAQIAYYHLGRRIYAYSALAKRWDVLELPEDPGRMETGRGSNSLTYELNGHIYTFDIETGKWDDLDTRAILDAPDETVSPRPKR